MPRLVARTLTSAKFWQRFHASASLVWLVLCIPGLLWWRESVAFVVLASLWANVVGHASSAQAARAERRVDPDDPLPGGSEGVSSGAGS